MVNSQVSAEKSPHGFIFHGKTSEYFLICLVNFLLCVITMGIYIPWALVKCRRYLYKNMELSGARFNYEGTGGAIFCSMLLTIVLSFVLMLVFSFISPALSPLTIFILIGIVPLAIVQSLRYQTMMTSLNNVRFGFNRCYGQAMWVFLGLPIVMMIAGVMIFYVSITTLDRTSGITAMVIHLIILALMGLLLVGIINGIQYGKGMQLLGRNARFGIHAFNIEISVAQCVKSTVLGMLIFLPFIIVIGKIIAPMYMQLFLMIAMGGITPEAKEALLAQYMTEFMVSYVLYFIALILAGTFIKASMRNIFINGLTLANSLRFCSSVTFVGLLIQYLTLVLATSFTCGLAYPWAKIRLVRYLANNTTLIGDLDALDLTDTDEQPDSGFFAILTRGAVPTLPLI